MTTFRLPQKRPYHHWTADAEDIIRAVYPTRGVSGVRVKLEEMGLPRRSPASIRKWASAHGVRCVQGRGNRAKKGDAE